MQDSSASADLHRDRNRPASIKDWRPGFQPLPCRSLVACEYLERTAPNLWALLSDFNKWCRPTELSRKESREHKTGVVFIYLVLIGLIFSINALCVRGRREFAQSRSVVCRRFLSFSDSPSIARFVLHTNYSSSCQWTIVTSSRHGNARNLILRATEGVALGNSKSKTP